MPGIDRRTVNRAHFGGFEEQGNDEDDDEVRSDHDIARKDTAAKTALFSAVFPSCVAGTKEVQGRSDAGGDGQVQIAQV